MHQLKVEKLKVRRGWGFSSLTMSLSKGMLKGGQK